jgi:hypothetical protein
MCVYVYSQGEREEESNWLSSSLGTSNSNQHTAADTSFTFFSRSSWRIFFLFTLFLYVSYSTVHTVSTYKPMYSYLAPFQQFLWALKSYLKSQ